MNANEDIAEVRAYAALLDITGAANKRAGECRRAVEMEYRKAASPKRDRAVARKAAKWQAALDVLAAAYAAEVAYADAHGRPIPAKPGEL